MVNSDDLKDSLVCDDGLTTVTLTDNPLVLVVDDEELMREITKLIVEDNGGTTIEATDGQEAVSKFKDNKDKIAYVFMDFCMPNLDGYEAFRMMKEIDPNVQVVIASGLNATDEIKQLAVDGEIEFISKPFHEAELLKAFNRLAERKG